MLRVRKSINYSKSLIVLGLATLGLFVAPHSAKALTLVNQTGFTDTDFENLINQGQFNELFVAEGRIGDLGGTATYELSINEDVEKGANPVQQQQYAWENNKPVDFSLEYTGSTVNYTVDGKLLSSNAFNGPVSDIFIRTFASNNSAVSLTNLAFNGEGIGNLGSSSLGIASDVDYLQIGEISDPFVITGKTSLFWAANPPRNSQLAYQIKVGGSSSSTSVPEPGTVGAIFLATVAGIGYGTRKKVKVASGLFH